MIESIVFVPHLIDNAFIIGRVLGQISKLPFVPYEIHRPLDPIQVPRVPGQTTKLIGTSSTLTAYHCHQISKKCVITSKSELSDTIVATALANSFESD